MIIVSTSSNGRSQESVFYSNTNKVRGRGRGGKLHFKVDTKARMVDIINMKVNLIKIDKETLEEEEVVEVMVEVIKVNNQIANQIATTVENLGTWQRTVIKGNMMDKMESCNKGIMHQLTIKVMSNCL
jgi:alpha-N-acetylglucosamine transferase